MGICTHHEQCPECAKLGKDRDHNNLAIYDDGSSYCFSCGYYKTKSGLPKLAQTQQVLREPLSLPRDVTTVLSTAASDFCGKYDLTLTDLSNNTILWSPWYERLIFPIFDNKGELLAWQGRYLGNKEKQAKWYSQGDLKTICHLIGNKKARTLVLTEDIISSIKVGHITTVKAMPIFGSHISAQRLLQIKPLCDTICVWLDKDKEKESLKFAKTAREFGIPAVSIITDKDPKDYTNDEIKEWLYKSLEFC